MDNDLEDWTNDLLVRSCQAIVRYEEHLRKTEPIGSSKDLAKAMRELKEVIPDELLEIYRV
jgi:hypothetical protein